MFKINDIQLVHLLVMWYLVNLNFSLFFEGSDENIGITLCERQRLGLCCIAVYGSRIMQVRVFLKQSGYCVFRFKSENLCILRTRCVYVLHVILKTKQKTEFFLNRLFYFKGTVLFNSVQLCTVLYSFVQLCTALYSSVHVCTALYMVCKLCTGL